MPQQDNILQELRELNSGLTVISRENIFMVPTGYFDDLAIRLLNRVKAMEAATPAGELAFLSPALSAISKKTPYAVPAGYFEGLEKRLEPVMNAVGDGSAAGELESLSPLLAGLKNKTTYTVPEGYFQKQAPVNEIQAGKPGTKVISLTSRKWFRYAAAAVVIGFVATLGFILFGGGKTTDDPSEKSFAWVKKNMKKVSTDDITEFVELAGAGTVDVAKTATRDEIMASLLKDVSDKEIQDFLNETQAAEPGTDDDLILN